MGCQYSKAEAPLHEVIPTKAGEGKRDAAAAKPAQAAGGASVRTEKQPSQRTEEMQIETSKDEVADNIGIKSAHGASVGDMETRASSAVSEEDAALRAEQTIEDALNDVREHLEEAEFFGAERILMTAIESLQSQGAAGNAYVEKLRKSEEYQKTLEELRIYERRVRDVLSTKAEKGTGGDDDDTPWRLAAEIELDYRRLGIELTPEAAAKLTKEERICSFYWRITKDKRAQVRAAASLPTVPANAPNGNMLMAWLAMTQEEDLVHTWHPICVGNGPTVFQPRRKYRFTWMNLIKFLLLKHAQIETATYYTNEENGSLVTAVNQSAPQEEIWKSHPPPSGYIADPMVAKNTIIVAPQSHTTYFGGMSEISSERPLPGFLVKLMATWLLPEMIRRMLAAIVKCLSPDGAYAPRIAADPRGVYGQTRGMVETGGRVDEAGHYDGKTLGAHNVPKPEQICARAKSLVKFEDSQH